MHEPLVLCCIEWLQDPTWQGVRSCLEIESPSTSQALVYVSIIYNEVHLKIVGKFWRLVDKVQIPDNIIKLDCGIKSFGSLQLSHASWYKTFQKSTKLSYWRGLMHMCFLYQHWTSVIVINCLIYNSAKY